MQLNLKTSLYFPVQWGTGLKYFAFSPDGQLIAVRKMYDWTMEDENIFIYDLTGDCKWCTRSRDGGETGVAFWQDKYHILAPGCGDGSTNPQKEGLKIFQIGTTGNYSDYTLAFANTGLVGPNISLFAASEDGKAVITNHGLQVGEKEYPKSAINHASEYYFSSDLRYLGGIRYYESSSWVIAIEEQKPLFDKEENFVAFVPNKKILTENNGVLSLWHLDSLQKITEARHPGQGSQCRILSAVSSDDGKLIALYNDYNHTLSILDGAQLTPLTTTIIAEKSKIRRLKFSNNQQFLLGVVMSSAYNAEEISIWSLDGN